MPRILRWAKQEAISVVPALIFFELSFNILHFSSVLMLSPDRVRYTSYLGATLGALVAAKIVIIVRSLPYINLFPHKPMLYNISWKFLIYGFFVLFVQLLDHFLRSLHHHNSFAMSLQQLGQMLTFAHFWGVQIWILFLFLIYITASEFNRVLGPLALRRMLLG